MKDKKYFLVSSVVLALIFCTWSYTRAVGSQITVCVKKTGLVYVIGQDFTRYDCKKTDQLLSWNSEGVQGPKGDKGDKGDIGERGPKGDSRISSSLHLYDANGQDLGILINADYYGSGFITYFSDKKVFMAYTQSPGEIKIPQKSTIYYTDNDCTGLARTNSFGNPLGVVVGPGGRFYKYTNELPTYNQQTKSILISGENRCVNNKDTAGSYPIEEIQELFLQPLIWPLNVK